MQWCVSIILVGVYIPQQANVQDAQFVLVSVEQTNQLRPPADSLCHLDPSERSYFPLHHLCLIYKSRLLPPAIGTPQDH